MSLKTRTTDLANRPLARLRKPAQGWAAVAAVIARLDGSGTRLHDFALKAGRPGRLGRESAEMFWRVLAAFPTTDRQRLEAELARARVVIPEGER